MHSPFEATDKLSWVTFGDEGLEQCDVFKEGNMSEEVAMQIVEQNIQECLGYSFHEKEPTYLWVVRRGSRKISGSGWTAKIFKVRLARADEADLYKDNFSDTPTALGSPDRAHGWARPGRGEGLGDALQDLNMVECVSPNDLRQGGLGDCWLVSAFAALAEFPGHVLDMIKPRTLAMDGRYVVSLFDYGKEKVVPVEVDDRLPKGAYGEPAFIKFTKDDEIWPCIVEKAVAKMAGSYEHIDGGDPLFALGMLSGCQDLIEFRELEKNRHWVCLKAEYRSCVPHSNDNRMVSGTWHNGDDGGSGKNWRAVLNLLAEYDAKDYLMCCGSHSGSDTTRNSWGVVQGHAYTILTVIKDIAGSGNDLIQLRNPWGSGEWKGDWSDHSNLWQAHPDVREAAKHQPNKDGIFWIEARDFFKNFSSIMVSRKSMGKNRAKKAANEPVSPPVKSSTTVTPPVSGSIGGAAVVPSGATGGAENRDEMSNVTTEILEQIEALHRTITETNHKWALVREALQHLRQETSPSAGTLTESRKGLPGISSGTDLWGGVANALTGGGAVHLE